jgi:hypothetical protein
MPQEDIIADLAQRVARTPNLLAFRNAVMETFVLILEDAVKTEEERCRTSVQEYIENQLQTILGTISDGSSPALSKHLKGGDPDEFCQHLNRYYVAGPATKQRLRSAVWPVARHCWRKKSHRITKLTRKFAVQNDQSMRRQLQDELRSVMEDCFKASYGLGLLAGAKTILCDAVDDSAEACRTGALTQKDPCSSLHEILRSRLERFDISIPDNACVHELWGEKAKAVISRAVDATPAYDEETAQQDEELLKEILTSECETFLDEARTKRPRMSKTHLDTLRSLADYEYDQKLLTSKPVGWLIDRIKRGYRFELRSGPELVAYLKNRVVMEAKTVISTALRRRRDNAKGPIIEQVTAGTSLEGEKTPRGGGEFGVENISGVGQRKLNAVRARSHYIDRKLAPLVRFGMRTLSLDPIEWGCWKSRSCKERRILSLRFETTPYRKWADVADAFGCITREDARTTAHRAKKKIVKCIEKKRLGGVA